MLENAWSTIFLCYVYSSPNFEIFGCQIKTKISFSIIGLYILFQCFRLGMDCLEMLISIYKNWLDDAWVGSLASMVQFMEMEEAVMKENEELTNKLGLLKLDENSNRV